jgi:hypothetical protein
MELTEGQKRYREYLKSEHWAGLKAKQPKKKCAVCRTNKNLDLHHMIYLKDWYKTTSKHLCWLCRRCHGLFHSTFGVTLPSSPARVRIDTKKLMREVLQKQSVRPAPVIFTVAQIEAAKTTNGGWTKKQLAAWGIPWPPPKGWKQTLAT